VTQPDNPRAVPGANNPPEPTPYEAAQQRIADLYQQAADYLDGDPIATQGQADDVSTLMRMLGEEIALADKLRIAEKKPFDDGAAEVQARWNTLIGETKKVTGTAVMAVQACKQALAPWLRKLAAEQEAAAKAAREEADRQREAAQAAIRAADAANLAERTAAEAKLREADAAERAARVAEKAKPHAGGSHGRAAHLRTYYDGVVVDGAEFHRWCVKHDREAMTAHLAKRAQELTDANVRNIPGVDVRERKEVA
jgi:hypothetical protein